jgi:predicted metal-dependent hydrolase
MRRATTPEGLEIIPRRLRLALSSATPKYWLANDPASTHLLNAMSITFPRGEQAFVDSVRHFKDRITDERLARDVRAFITQEMHHSRSHLDFNAWLRGLGLPVEAIEADVERDTSAAQRDLSPEVLLAVTCALEHFTAILAHAFLTSPGLLASMHEDVRLLWLWHAIEETEHKAVAFDVYTHVGGRYEIRVATMAVITALFVGKTASHVFDIMKNDGHGKNAFSWATLAMTFFGPRGHFSKLGPLYRAYYRRDFHPWQHDDRALLQAARADLAAGLAKQAGEHEAYSRAA